MTLIRQPKAIIQNELTSGTNGGTATAGAWTIIPMNTIVTDPSGIVVSLAANQFELVPGDYIVEGMQPFQATNRSRIRLQNITGATTLALGSNGFAAGSGSYAASTFEGSFTVAASQTLEFQYRVDTTKATDGLGVQSGFGVTEVYGQLQFQRIG